MGGRKAWSIVFLGAIFYMYQFSVRVSPNSMQNDIMVAFSINAAVFGLVVGCYYIAYSAIQIPLGMLMDYFGPKRFMSGAGFLCGFSCVLFASTRNVYVASIARFMMGLGAACGLLGTIKLGTMWIPPKHISKVIALTMAMGTTGALLGGAPLDGLIKIIGWENAFYVLGFIGCIIGALIYIGVHDKKIDDYVSSNIGLRFNISYQFKNYKFRRKFRFRSIIRSRYKFKSKFSKIFTLKRVLTSSQAWLISIVGMMMYVPLTLFGIAWSKQYMMELYSLGEQEALFYSSSMLFLGSALGSPFFSFLSDYMARRRAPMMIGAMSALIANSIICFFTGMPLFVTSALFFLVGFFYTSKCLCFASICEIMPSRASGGLAVGFTNTIVMQTGVLFHPIIGHLLSHHYDGSLNLYHGTNNIVPFFTESDFRFAFTLIPVCIIIALIVIKLIRETHPGRYS